MNLNNNSIIIFAKNPVMGKVKTRLAEKVGKEKAFEIYRMLLEKIYIETKNLNCKKFLFLSDNLDENLFDSGFTQLIQKGNDIGERMCEAFKYVFNEGFAKVILIGTDIPELDSQIIAEAFNKLSRYDIVIGPAKDGGYYLIGMKEPMNFLFENMQWSSENVLNKTIERIMKEKKGYYLLKELNDLDNEEDLRLLGS